MINEDAIKRALALFEKINPHWHPDQKMVYESGLRSNEWNFTKDAAMQGYIEHISQGEVFTIEKWLMQYQILIDYAGRRVSLFNYKMTRYGKKFSFTSHNSLPKEALLGLKYAMAHYEMHPVFEDWCEELGRDKDSINDLREFKQARKWRNLFIAQFGEECYRALINYVVEV